MVRTVRAATGLPIHHYVEIDFVGFQALVNEIGGVHIDFPYPARDANSGLNVEAGRQLLDGSQALAYRALPPLRGTAGRLVGRGRRRRLRPHPAPAATDPFDSLRAEDSVDPHRGGFDCRVFCPAPDVDSALAQNVPRGTRLSNAGHLGRDDGDRDAARLHRRLRRQVSREDEPS